MSIHHHQRTARPTGSLQRRAAVADGAEGSSAPAARSTKPKVRSLPARNELDEVEAVAQIGSYTLDVRSGRWLSSKGLDAILGIDPSFERSVEGWTSLIHPDDRGAMAAYFANDVLGRRGRFDRQYRIVRPDTGEERWVHGRGVLDLDRSGRPIRMVGTIADISDQVGLESQNRRLAQALVHTDEAVLITGPNGEFVFANPAFERLIGVVPSDLLADTLAGLADEIAPGASSEIRQALADGGHWSGEIAHRRLDGATQISECSISPIVGTDRSVMGYITVARDVTERRDQARERDRLAAAVEQSTDGIVVTDREWRFVYANGAYAAMVGVAPSELVGRLAYDVAGMGLDASTLADMAVAVRAGRPWVAEVDHRNPDDSHRRLEVTVRPIHDPGGEISGWVGVMRDVTERVEAAAALTASEARLQTVVNTMLEGVTVLSSVRDADGRIVDFRIEYANASIGDISGVAPAIQLGRTVLELFPAHRTSGLFDAYVAVVETGVPYDSGPVHYVDPAAAGGRIDQIVEQRATKLGDGFVLSVRDITAHHHADLQMRRLAYAIEQTADAVVITDVNAHIEYVNPAFERVTGYSRAEVLGENPRILKSGVQGPAFYAAMWAALTSGQSFTADMTNRRKDGSLFQEEAVVSPIRDEAGAITSFVAVKRDVTRERAAEVAAERLARERALVAGTLAEVRAGPTPEATAEAICRQLASLPGAVTANLAYFTSEGPVMPLAFVRADGQPGPLHRLPYQRSRAVRDRAAEGPWVEAWVRRPWHPYDRLFGELGIKAVAHAPIRHNGAVIGYLTVTSADSDAVGRLTELLPALLEFAGFAGALVGPAIDDLTEVGKTRERIAQTIKAGSFRPVFQPIVDVATGAHLGYEALTRFLDGSSPDRVFADARASGLELDLELATLGAAIDAATALPAGAWLSVNVSPGLVIANGRLAHVLRRADRPLVLEVTEHVPVDDYAALRDAIGRLRPRVRVAVDDVGSGIANFGHIVELRPAFVKLDLGLVRRIDADLTRQALVVGLLHFSNESSSLTIAEGVETEDELATLRRLGVPLAQGYLLGRPAPVG
jgi:PAS domain S-box-containing protein